MSFGPCFVVPIASFPGKMVRSLKFKASTALKKRSGKSPVTTMSVDSAQKNFDERSMLYTMKRFMSYPLL